MDDGVGALMPVAMGRGGRERERVRVRDLDLKPLWARSVRVHPSSYGTSPQQVLEHVLGNCGEQGVPANARPMHG